MKYTFIILTITTLLSCNQKEDTFHMPAEWEPQDAVWLGWEPYSVRGYYPVVTEMIETLTPHVTVKIAFDSDSLMQTAKQLELVKIDKKIKLI
tara:strand:+ start:3770 stop:4048 length:279 start_codon:yes stop_codon:yes gene_type:complete